MLWLQLRLHSKRPYRTCMRSWTGQSCVLPTQHFHFVTLTARASRCITQHISFTRAPQVYAELDWAALPLLPGAAECLEGGVLSSLHSQNARASASVSNFKEVGGFACNGPFRWVVVGKVVYPECAPSMPPMVGML